MKNYLDFRSELIAKYGEEEVKKAETDNFYMGTIPFEESAILEFQKWQSSQAQINFKN